MERMSIGIIGFGQMGQFLARHLNERHDVVAADALDRAKEAAALGIQFAGAAEAAGQDVVIFAVPTSALRQAIAAAKPFLRADAIVLDICSVKVLPCRLMSELPNEIVGTHPLFGPQSGAGGIAGLPVVVCPVRASAATLDAVRNLFLGLGLDVIVATPEEHDQAMATSHALLHFIALPLMRLGDQRIKISALDKARALADVFRHDSPQLFRDVQMLNSFAAPLRKQLIKQLQEIDEGLS